MRCSLCGLEMRRLSAQIWRCRCGHKEVVTGGRGRESRSGHLEENYDYYTRKNKGIESHTAIFSRRAKGDGTKRTSSRGV